MILSSSAAPPDVPEFKALNSQAAPVDSFGKLGEFLQEISQFYNYVALENNKPVQ